MSGTNRAVTAVLAGRAEIKDWQQQFYKTLHEHPELGHHEVATAAAAATALREYGFEVHEKVGSTGVVGVLTNGDGPVVLMRADMDALPVHEATGLPYASTVQMADRDGNQVPVMHACGHDAHVACLLSAARLLAGTKDACDAQNRLVSKTLRRVIAFGEISAPAIPLCAKLIPSSLGFLLVSPVTQSSFEGLRRVQFEFSIVLETRLLVDLALIELKPADGTLEQFRVCISEARRFVLAIRVPGKVEVFFSDVEVERAPPLAHWAPAKHHVIAFSQAQSVLDGCEKVSSLLERDPARELSKGASRRCLLFRKGSLCF